MRDVRGYDPESLLTGAEVEQGLGYDNSRRVFESPQVKRAIVNSGLISELAILAPRTLTVTFGKFFAEGKYHDSARYQGD